MFTADMQGAKPVLDNMSLPEVFYTPKEHLDEGEASGPTLNASLEKKLSTIEMAFFFRGNEQRDVSLVRNRVYDISSGETESSLDDGVICLPDVDKEVLKHIFREAFHERCSNYDDVELISEALAQNCIEQLQCKKDGRLRGSFKMTIVREFSPDGVSDFSFALSAFQSKFQGLDALAEKCDIKLSRSDKTNKHKVEIRPKRNRRPSMTRSEGNAAREIKEVLKSGGSIMIPEEGFRRELICRELLETLGIVGKFQDKMYNALESGVAELEQEGYAFRGRGVVTYVTAGGSKKERPKVYFILKPFSDGPYPEVKKLKGLQRLFLEGMQKGEPTLKVNHFFKIDTFEADSFFFDGHAAIELSRLRI